MFSKLFTRSSQDPSVQDAAIDTVAPVGTAVIENRSALVGVLGAKGGVGATTIALNLAATMSTRGITTTVVDADFQQPGLAYLVGREPQHSMLELFTRAPDLDEHMLSACSVSVTDNGLPLSALMPPLNGEAGLKADLTELAACLSVLKNQRRMWVLDMPRHLDRHLVTMLDACDKIVLVFEATVAGVALCRRWLETFRELDYPADRTICLLNRSSSKFRAVEDQLGQSFDDNVIVRAPNAASIMWECDAMGKPAVLAYPNHAFTRALGELSELIGRSVYVR